MHRRQRGKKDKAPRGMDDDYATNPLHGVYEGGRRCSMQLLLGVQDFVTCPVTGMKKGGALTSNQHTTHTTHNMCVSGTRGLLKGVCKGTLSLVCRPTSGAIDLVERTFEGIVLCPGAILDSCQKVGTAVTNFLLSVGFGDFKRTLLYCRRRYESLQKKPMEHESWADWGPGRAVQNDDRVRRVVRFSSILTSVFQCG